MSLTKNLIGRLQSIKWDVILRTNIFTNENGEIVFEQTYIGGKKLIITTSGDNLDCHIKIKQGD